MYFFSLRSFVSQFLGLKEKFQKSHFWLETQKKITFWWKKLENFKYSTKRTWITYLFIYSQFIFQIICNY